MKIELDGKKALVTGGSKGIGRAICKALSDAGAKVYINYNTDKNGAEETASMCKDSEVVKFDVSNHDEVKASLKKIQVDIVVNNAGISMDGLLLRLNREKIEKVISVNLLGAIWVTKEALRGMLKKGWGRIINISSIVGITGNAGQTPYASSKAGLIAFTKSLAKEVGSRGITVNCIAPGFIETSMTDVFTEEDKRRMLSQIPAGRLGKPEDVAWVVTFLSSDYASYINGEVINVSGGLYM